MGSCFDNTLNVGVESLELLLMLRKQRRLVLIFLLAGRP
jgi:hypothetical protein